MRAIILSIYQRGEYVTEIHMTNSLVIYGKLTGVLVVLVFAVGIHLVRRGLQTQPTEGEWQVPVANQERGREMIRHHGCGACHTIPGIRDATGLVGPPLDHLRDKMYIAGVLVNNPQNLAYWIQEPRETNPLTAMPDLGVGPEDARDIAAYLYANP